jgi:hypothetical protein
MPETHLFRLLFFHIVDGNKMHRISFFLITLFICGASTASADRLRFSIVANVLAPASGMGIQTKEWQIGNSIEGESTSVTANSIQYVTERGWILGKMEHFNEFTDLKKNGELIGERESTSVLSFWDFGYLFSGETFSLGFGWGIPVLGREASETIHYGLAANSGIDKETIKSNWVKSSSRFVDFGITFGNIELLLGMREISATREGSLNRSNGLGKLLNRSRFTASTSYSLTTLGIGFFFW